MDERDTSWEIDTPTFRAFFYRGSSNAVTAVDITDTDVLGAFRWVDQEASERVANYALALVVDLYEAGPISDPRPNGRGLVYLIGADLNNPTPSGGAERMLTYRRNARQRPI